MDDEKNVWPKPGPDEQPPSNVGAFIPIGPTKGLSELIGAISVQPSDPFPQGGVKFDDGKLPYHLIAPELQIALAEILAFGAKKYAPRNWEKGMDWHRPFRACLGHLWDWWARRGPDPETGKSHLWHAACCIMFLVTYEMRSIGKDDRPPAA